MTEASIFINKPCHTHILIRWKDIDVGTIRINAFPDIRVLQIMRISIENTGMLPGVRDWDHLHDLMLSLAYPLYRCISGARIKNWTVEFEALWGWTPERSSAHVMVMKNINQPTKALFDRAVHDEIVRFEQEPHMGGGTYEAWQEYYKVLRRFVERVSTTLFENNSDLRMYCASKE